VTVTVSIDGYDTVDRMPYAFCVAGCLIFVLLWRSKGDKLDMLPSASFILIVYQYTWHAPFLNPLFELLSQHHFVQCIAMTDFTGNDFPSLARKPDLIIVADAGTAVILRPNFSDTTILHVGHGLISKNGPALSYHAADYVCVASPSVAHRLTKQGHVPRRAYLPTGLIQSDPLFKNINLDRSIKAPGTAANVIYAPTWTPRLSSAAMLGDKIIDLIRGGNTKIDIAIKPHPHLVVIAPDLIQCWRDLTETQENVTFHSPDSDLIPALLGADLMVSDASSAVFHFLALDRPIVLIDNPERISSTVSYDPDGIEWQWRDIGTRIDQVGDLRSAVETSLAEPDKHRAMRRARRTELFGDLTDGRARERVAEAVDLILRGEI
jgi:hypothetical protein